MKIELNRKHYINNGDFIKGLKREKVYIKNKNV